MKHDSHDFDSAKEAAKILNRHGYSAYIVGGAVRDLWLDRHPRDFDLVTSATPEQIMSIDEFEHSKYKDTAQAFGVTRVQFTHGTVSGQLEIATFRKDIEAHKGRRATKVVYADLQDDLMRRDFTINALALDPLSGQVIDLAGGIADLDEQRIKFIGQPLRRIQEDPLRLMRAVRFKNHLDFSYHASTVRAIKKAVSSGYVEHIAVDRLRDELSTLLAHHSRHLAFEDLDELGILGRVLPEVTAGKGVKQPPQFHAEGDVFRHQLLALKYLPSRPSKRLAWATLLHDIGKAPTQTPPRTPSGRIRFDRHYAVGAEMAKDIMRRLKFSNRDISDITWMIHNHMAIDDLPLMRPSRQEHMLGHPAFADLLKLHQTDAAASWRPGRPHGQKPNFQEINRLWRAYKSKPPHLRRPSLKKDLSIDGDWLLNNFKDEFNLSPGPIIGQVLEELNDWYKDEGVKDQQSYVAKARSLLKKHLKPD